MCALLVFASCKKNEPIDEAKAAGKSTADFPQITADVFKPMDGGIDLSPEEIMGRNTWNLWSGGNEHFWNHAAQDSFGLMDLLKMLDNRKFPRGERFKVLGLVNEPGFRAASKPDEFGLWLDEEAEPEPAGIDRTVYGKPSGVLGFRLFPNPDFNEEARKKWNGDRFVNDPAYYNDNKLIRPYRVGVACASPLLLVAAPFYIFALRRREKSDPVVCPSADQKHSENLSSFEDHDVTNQFSAMGSLKPGLVRLLTTSVVLKTVNYGARHITRRGRLGRIRSIHFARWVFVAGRERMIFCSNYDGSVESYMDDFINKTGFGLNASFSNGIGYPRTNWLVRDGCIDERNYKEYLRRHTLPSQVWYKAYPRLTQEFYPYLANKKRITPE